MKNSFTFVEVIIVILFLSKIYETKDQLLNVMIYSVYYFEISPLLILELLVFFFITLSLMSHIKG